MHECRVKSILCIAGLGVFKPQARVVVSGLRAGHRDS